MPKKKKHEKENIKTQLKKCCYSKTQVLFKDKEKKRKKKKWEYGAGGEEKSDNAAPKELWQEMTGSKWKK